MQTNEQLLNITKKLNEYIEEAYHHFLEVKKSGDSPDFYKEVKPFTDEVKTICDDWSRSTLKWMSLNRPKTIHPQQIEVTIQNIEIAAMQSFFPKTSLVKFTNLIKSIKYVLHSIIIEISDHTK